MHGQNQTVFVKMPESVTVVDNEKRHTKEMTPLAMGWAKSEDKLGFTYAVHHFFDCIRNDKTPLTDPHDAYKTHELLNSDKDTLQAVKNCADKNGIRIICLTPYNSRFNSLDESTRLQEVKAIEKVINAP